MPPTSAGLEDRQHQAYLLSLRPITIFSLADVVLLAVFFWPQLPHGPLLGWTGVSLAVLVGWLLVPSGWFRHPWLPTVHAVSEALLFGGFVAGALPSLQGPWAMVLGAFATGLMAAGTLVKYPYPRTAWTFSSLMVVALELGLWPLGLPSAWPIALLAILFGISLGVLAGVQFRHFSARVEAEEEVERQKSLVTHLLMDFSESASEGLWECDPQGRLTLVSPRLAQMFDLPESALLGRPLGAPEEWLAVLAPGNAFRDQEITVEVGGSRHWWLVSGKPVKDEGGEVRGWRGAGSDITGRRLQELEQVRLSRLDGLTGLLNRDAFRQLVSDFAATPEVPRPWSLVLLDIVGFRDVNETRGHLFGDALIRAVADRLRANVRPETLLARLGGDEFALLASVDPNDPALRHRWTVIWDQLNRPFDIGGQTVTVGFHAGGALFPTQAITAEDWLRAADLALREAKATSHRGLLGFQPELLARYHDRILLVDELRMALVRRQLEVHYQPQVRMADGSRVGYEALMRWTHPTRGPIPPVVFIPLAEEAALMDELGAWILDQSVKAAAGWPTHEQVSVNVTAGQLQASGFAALVDQTLERWGVPPSRLILEVTESALLADASTVRTNLEALKRRGVSLALDDFGTGYSALSYLQKFPFDILKIDRAFVTPAVDNPRSAALLASVIGMAGALGLATVAEGIETVEQASFLQRLGCDKGQGWLYGKPQPLVPTSNS